MLRVGREGQGLISRPWMWYKAMLLRLFKSVGRCVSDSSKIVYFRRILHGCGIESEESSQLRYKGVPKHVLGAAISGESANIEWE